MVQPLHDLHSAFVRAFSSGDLDALMALYEPSAVLVPEPGRPAVTGQALRDALQGFLALNATIRLTTEQVMQAGDLVLLRSKWTLTGTGPDGTSVTMAHRSIEVARRQPDGSWRYVIDDPFGAT